MAQRVCVYTHMRYMQTHMGHDLSQFLCVAVPLPQNLYVKHDTYTCVDKYRYAYNAQTLLCKGT